jgi:hypothetical protein
MMAALIWKNGLRTFRLVRAHEAKQLRDGLAKVNLASLPEELLSIIEDNISDTVRKDVARKTAFLQHCECDAFQDELHDSDEMKEALDAFASPSDSDLSDYGGSDYGEFNYDLYEGFWDGPGFESVYDIVMRRHLDLGNCQTYANQMDYWEQIVLRVDSPRSSNFQMVSRSNCQLRHVIV